MDLHYLLGLQGLRESLSGALDGFFLLASQLGKAELPMAVTLIVYWCFSRELGQRLLFTLNGSDLLNNVLKLGFCVYRPWVREPALPPPRGIPSPVAIPARRVRSSAVWPLRGKSAAGCRGSAVRLFCW